MSHKESGWQPTGTGMEYKGDEVWDHNIAPSEVNVGERDPEWKREDADESEE